MAALGLQAAQADQSSVQAILEQYLTENEIAGGALIISSGDGETHAAYAGVADEDTQTPVDANTRFYIASTGKMMVAAAIMANVDQRRIGLDELVWPHISSLPGIEGLENAQEVTLRQLLNHTSGLVDYLTDDYFELTLSDPKRNWRPEEALALAYGEPADFAPNQGFEYSNTNYVLLGHFLEQLDGGVRQSLSTHVFTPAGMANSSVGADASETGLAHGYGGDPVADMSDLAWASELGDGPVVSTVTDLVAFARALFEDFTLLSEDLVTEMTTGSAQDPSYGLGIGIDGDDWGEWVGHSGGYEGFEADLRYYPDHGLVLAYVVNGNAITDTDLLEQAAELYFEK